MGHVPLSIATALRGDRGAVGAPVLVAAAVAAAAAAAADRGL